VKQKQSFLCGHSTGHIIKTGLSDGRKAKSLPSVRGFAYDYPNTNTIWELSAEMTATLTFDIKQYDFSDMILGALNLVPGLKSLENLDAIHENIGASDLTEIEARIYDCFRQSEFQTKYSRLCQELIDEMFQGHADYQKIPSIRIQFPNSKTVNFHTDCWYGHGEEVQNFWLPLVDVQGNESLAILDDDESDKALDKFYAEAPSIIEINEYCEQKCWFVKLKYGEILHFPAKLLHGTLNNTSDCTRISFDFRMRVENSDTGTKQTSFFSNSEKNKNNNLEMDEMRSPELALAYINPILESDMQLSQKHQILININYARENKFSIIVHETELIGFKNPLNLEDMLFGTRRGLARDIICFSEKCIPERGGYRKHLIERALLEGYRIHFVAEDIIIGN